jgi:hypothetical protein
MIVVEAFGDFEWSTGSCSNSRGAGRDETSMASPAARTSVRREVGTAATDLGIGVGILGWATRSGRACLDIAIRRFAPSRPILALQAVGPSPVRLSMRPASRPNIENATGITQ